MLLGGCAVLKDSFPLASPSAGGDQTVGFKYETGSNNDVVAEEGPAGGAVGKIGGDGDSVALWIAIAVLGLVAVSAYPAQRGLRLAWNSWRGRSGPRNGKGRETVIRFAEWDT